jgi:hypothetical protein
VELDRPRLPRLDDAEVLRVRGVHGATPVVIPETPLARDPAGRCAREGTQTAPLHAVPRQPVATRVAASLPAADLHALCGPCHETTARKQTAALAQAQRDQADTEPLF